METKKLKLKQVYDMFGCNKKLNLEEIFNILLYSIVEIGYNDTITITSYSEDAINQVYLHFYYKKNEIKNMLLKYLETPVSMSEAKKLDDFMLIMKKETETYKSIPWYQIVSKIKALKNYKKTANKTVRIEKVFQLLKYRAVYQLNISVADLKNRFYKYAETFANEI